MLKNKYFNDSFILHEPSSAIKQLDKFINTVSRDKEFKKLDIFLSQIKHILPTYYDIRSNIDKKMSILPHVSSQDESFNCFKIQFLPLKMVKKYFGEEIGIYFAWVEHLFIFLISLSIIGVIFYIIGITRV